MERLQGCDPRSEADLPFQHRGRSPQRTRKLLGKVGQYPQISKSWRNHWANLNTIFDYPEDIRKAIYTTNAIESLNSVIRKATKKRKVFPNDNAAFKVVYLATQAASKKWTMPIKNWKRALNRFVIEFEEQLAPHL